MSYRLAARLKGALAQERRASQVRTAYYLRHAQVGAAPVVVGAPVVENRRLTVGDGLLLWSKGGRAAMLVGSGAITLGDRVFINSGAIIDAREHVRVGDDVAVSYDAYIADNDSHGIEGRPPRVAPVTIGSGTWIGLRAVILPGVTIGRRCVVAAHSVVRSDVPDDTLVAGAPAQVVRQLVYPPGVTKAWTD